MSSYNNNYRKQKRNPGVDYLQPSRQPGNWQKKLNKMHPVYMKRIIMDSSIRMLDKYWNQLPREQKDSILKICKNKMDLMKKKLMMRIISSF